MQTSGLVVEASSLQFYPGFQVSQNASGQASFYKYETDDTESASQALFMNYSEVETQGKWCRFWSAAINEVVLT